MQTGSRWLFQQILDASILGTVLHKLFKQRTANLKLEKNSKYLAATCNIKITPNVFQQKREKLV